MKKLATYKGFDKDLKCRDMQYEVGKEFTESGKIECCNRGLHSCEYPLNVLGFYPPINDNRYCTTEASGVMDK